MHSILLEKSGIGAIDAANVHMCLHRIYLCVAVLSIYYLMMIRGEGEGGGGGGGIWIARYRTFSRLWWPNGS